MPRVGENLSLEPSLEEEDYIHETDDDFEENSEEDYELKDSDREEEKERFALFELAEKF